MPLYVGDYLADTNHLTTLEHGAYLLLIMHYWQHGPLPDDESQLRQITRLEARQWRRVKKAVLGFFRKEAGIAANFDHAMQANAEQMLSNCWHHKRLDAEREKAEILSTKRQLAGQRGGLRSRGLTNMGRHVTSAIAKQMGTQSHKERKEREGSTEEERTSISPSLADVVRARGWAP